MDSADDNNPLYSGHTVDKSSTAKNALENYFSTLQAIDKHDGLG